MKSDTGDASTLAPAGEFVESSAQSVTLPERRIQAWRQWLVVLSLICSDILLASLFWGLALALQPIWGGGPLSVELTLPYILGDTAAWIGLRALLGLYPGYGLSPAEELRRQTYATIATLAIVGIFALGFQAGDSLSRLLIVVSFLERLILAPLGRHFVKLGLEKLELWGKPVVILGAGETGKLLVHILQREWGLGYKPLAVFDFRLAPKGRVLEGVPYGGTVTDALNLAQKQRIDTVIFAMTHVRRQYLARFVEGARSGFRHVIVIPNLIGITTSAVTASDLAGVFGVEIKQNLLSPWTLRIKRMLDLVATVTGGILILPLLLAISFLLWVSSRGGVFYRAQRIGQDGKHFSCLKFRTMVPEAEATLQRMLEENAELRGEYSKYHKLRDDPRITRIGRFLRKTSLDELPQLWNVLRGEMSLVGPRPYLARETEEIQDALHGERSMIGLGLYLPPDYKESRPTQNEILRVPPGITGPWQVAGRNHTSFRERVHMDAYYVRNWSIWIDLIILARTVGILIFGRGAF